MRGNADSKREGCHSASEMKNSCVLNWWLAHGVSSFSV